MGRTVAELELDDGRMAKVSFLSKEDSTRELLLWINRLIAEKAYILADKKLTMKKEGEWKKNQLEMLRKRTGYTLIARVDGKIAGTSGATQGRTKERGCVMVGLAIAKPYRRQGLGEALLRLNVKTAKGWFRPRPRNIWLSVFRENKAAYRLYKKVGFKEFAVWPKWYLHEGRYIDAIVLKL